MTEEQRDALVMLASKRGERGFSRVVQEAIDCYLEMQRRQASRSVLAAKLRGSLAGAAGENLQNSVQAVRQSWDR